MEMTDELTVIVCDIFIFRLFRAEHKIVQVVAIFPDHIL